MDPERLKRLKKIFQAAVELDMDRRPTYLDRACGGDPTLRDQVEAMLAADIPTGEFVEPLAQQATLLSLSYEAFSGKKVGRYLLKEIIASGGMGVIYRAEDQRLKRTVALKFLAPHVEAGMKGKARFLQEARAAAALDHPNICMVHEIDKAEGQAFIAMAYIEGQSLKQKIEAGPMKLDEVLDLAIQTAAGLEAAHNKGIIHRDIKPANLMVTTESQVKIVDFGLAKLAGETRITRSGVTLGTVSYMSPEQARGEEVDHRTDIWSLGVVMYEMLTGQLPFKGENVQSVMFAILQQEPIPIADLRPGLPRGVQETLNKALAKNPDERYRHVKDMLVDLRLLRHDPALIVTVIPTSPAKSRSSIAVLPFMNMSADPEQEYFCDGMAEELINALSKLENLRVMARTSSFAFKGEKTDIGEIGRKLKVGAILEGSVRKANNRVRITAQLVSVEEGYHLWANQYDREMADIFAIQDEITLAIVSELRVRLLEGEKTRLLKPREVDTEAYHLYWRGRHFWNKGTADGYQRAVEYYRRSMEKEPAYTLPYSGMADSYLLMGVFKSTVPRQAFIKAKKAAKKALALDATLAEAHTSLAMCHFLCDWDFKISEGEFKKAISLNPSYSTAHEWYAKYLTVMGRYGEAITEATRAQELDPLSPRIGNTLGQTFYMARQYDRAIEELDKVIEIDPKHGPAYLYLGSTYNALEKYEEAVACLKKMYSMMYDLYPDPEVGPLLGSVYGLMGKTEEAKKVLEGLYALSKQRYVPSLDLAYAHAGLGQVDKVFELLDKALEERDPFLFWMRTCHCFKDVRLDPRFPAFMKKMGFES